MSKYLIAGRYVTREEYQKHLESERQKLTATIEKAEKEAAKPAPKGDK